ncbi:MAG TPA: histidine kinase [Streptosporangiaceae bacterium]|nr:histidine kinase [Streptosporangiaceae bacterium]
MLPTWVVLTVSAAYISVLFGVAFYADRRARAGRSGGSNGTVYALSLAVYATSWTYYGSVGHAATSGLGFLPIYLGPTLMFALGWVVLRRIIRISRRHRITSLADFVAARYGHSAALGGLVTVVAVVGVVPYIALQLKAVSNTFEIIRTPLTELHGHVAKVPLLHDTGLYIALALAAFAILFGTRHLDASEHHQGVVAAIAFESVVKLLIFLAAGFFITFGIFGGFGNLFARAAADRHAAALLTLGHGSYSTFVWLTVLSMLAIVLLPRQWQVTVVENVREVHLLRAMWLFPLYLLAINIFVLPIALGGVLRFGSTVNPDTYVLALPMAAGQRVLALAVFIGGLSAATGMIIVETVALSTMVSNSLVLPLLLRGKSRLARKHDLTGLILGVRRTAIAAIVLIGYGYFRLAGQGTELVEIGLVSFVAVAQFAPAVFGALFWKGGTRNGALAGLAAGFILWVYTLLLPTFALAGLIPESLVRRGPFGLGLLRPTQLFGVTGMDQYSQAMFWSLLVNVGLYVGVSLMTQQSRDERSQAALFVDALADPARARRLARVSVSDLMALAQRFLGPAGVEKALGGHARRHSLDASPSEVADPELLDHVEALLVGSVGATVARLVVASVLDEEQLEPDKLIAIVDEASQLAALEERHRLARDLHDSVSQALFSMTLHTRAMELAIRRENVDPDGPVANNLAELRNLSRSALTEMRALIFQLRPGALHEEGLAVAVRRHAAAVAAKEGLDVEVDVPEGRLALGERVIEELFRITEEALRNSVKHAQASRIGILLVEDAATTGTLILEVTDDGVGFWPDAPYPGHLGMRSMRERAERIGGQLTVDSCPDGPTTVRVVLPGILPVPTAPDGEHSGNGIRSLRGDDGVS